MSLNQSEKQDQGCQTGPRPSDKAVYIWFLYFKQLIMTMSQVKNVLKSTLINNKLLDKRILYRFRQTFRQISELIYIQVNSMKQICILVKINFLFILLCLNYMVRVASNLRESQENWLKKNTDFIITTFSFHLEHNCHRSYYEIYDLPGHICSLL